MRYSHIYTSTILLCIVYYNQQCIISPYIIIYHESANHKSGQVPINNFGATFGRQTADERVLDCGEKVKSQELEVITTLVCYNSYDILTVYHIFNMALTKRSAITFFKMSS